MLKEINKEIKEIGIAPGYFIDKTGNVYSKRNKGKENVIVNGVKMYQLKKIIDDKGYVHYNIHHVKMSAHRLVAMAYIPNPNNYPIINHKDLNPKNNNVDNLEWCTYSYNTHYTYLHGKNMRTKYALVYKNDILVKGFPNLSRAAAYIAEKNNNSVSPDQVGKRKQYKDYKIVIPENGDSIDYSKSANHHFTTKERKKACVLYHEKEIINEFESKGKALEFCKEKFGTCEYLRRYNADCKRSLYLVIKGVNDLDSVINEAHQKMKNSKKGHTSKKKGFLYHGNVLIDKFQSINSARNYCKEKFNAAISPTPPYCNISKKLLFLSEQANDQELYEIWDQIIKRSKNKSHHVW